MSGTVAEEMRGLLTEAFAPTILEIINDSAQHAGHAGDDGSGESHFTIVIEAPSFARYDTACAPTRCDRRPWRYCRPACSRGRYQSKRAC